MPDENQNSIQVPTIWEESNDVPALYVNEMLLKPIPGQDGTLESVAILFGTVEAPNFTGTEEEQRAAMEGVTHVPIEVRSKVVIGAGRLRAFADALSSFADRIEGPR